MINTYQTSVAPPPLPPRLDRPQPMLIPARLPSPGHSRPLLRFLVCVMVLQLFMSVGGFLYLFYNGRMNGGTPVEAKTASLSGKMTSSKTWAKMIVERPRQTTLKPAPGYLQWDMTHSIRRNVNYYQRSWLTVLQPGDYYVFSRVTFSKGTSKSPLASFVKLKKSKAEKDENVMLAYCSLDSHGAAAAAIPRLCTATQGEVMVLESGDQLSVWVEDVSLVDYSQGATAFGMYKL